MRYQEASQQVVVGSSSSTRTVRLCIGVFCESAGFVTSGCLLVVALWYGHAIRRPWLC